MGESSTGNELSIRLATSRLLSTLAVCLDLVDEYTSLSVGGGVGGRSESGVIRV